MQKLLLKRAVGSFPFGNPPRQSFLVLFDDTIVGNITLTEAELTQISDALATGLGDDVRVQHSRWTGVPPAQRGG
jgi:hypothetical protein